MRSITFALTLFAFAQPALRGDEPDGARPLYHFTPPKNFINDPNGLVYRDGLYHLFYQHNPEGDRWGHMSWGHAVSRDLVRWEHWPIALHEEDGIMIFSGSAVVDARNTSGVGQDGAGPMIAVYTGHGHGKQTQNIASSVDGGRTWTKFRGNPVIDIKSNAFRDPKVFWHSPTRRWVMATVLADERKVRLWGSTDLKQWKQLSGFGPAAATKGVWECPELFEAPIEGAAGESRWVLKEDVGDGAVAGGSGGQYFVGTFDGTTFRPENSTPGAAALWFDHGKDFYATQCWNDAPGGRPVWLAWMNNWQYANDIPTTPWRGAMTTPRTVALRRTAEGLRIAQAPVPTVESLRHDKKRLDARPIPAREISLETEGISGQSLEIIADVEPRDAESFGLKVLNGENEETLIGIDRRAGTVFVDRTRSGNVGFSPHFPGRHSARLSTKDNGSIRLHVLVDVTSVEVFADDGLAVITDQVFPRPTSRGVSLFATGGAARLRSLEAWELRP